MSSERLKIHSVTVLAVLLAVGCAGLPYQKPLPVSQVTRDHGETIIVDQIFILADASATMKCPEKFPVEKSLVESFVAAMPEGRYGASLIDFGGGMGTTPTAASYLYPLQPFDRRTMGESASALEYLSGQTPMEVALGKVRDALKGASGKTAVVIFSDGKATHRRATIAACESLLEWYQDPICIHTVQIGSCAGKCADLMRTLATTSDCGSYRTAADIDSASAMEDFVREVMLGEAQDRDGDGVPDNLDQCPDTPKGVKVDKVGCPIDTDGDGVPDYLDQCPGTPKGVKVDRVGCPPDTDGDGVYDYLDKCPGTPKGAKVDSVGCWILPIVHFDTDKSIIKPHHQQELNEVARVLKQNPDVKIAVQGHTDAKASDAYNQKLSERRAAAVSTYLAKQGVAAAALKAEAFGESRPAKPNDTPGNMTTNRRVELRIIR